MNENIKVDFYFEKNKNWTEEINELRKIVLSTNLEEVLKWGCPCYVLKNKNVVLIHTFKEYCALLFFKGALMTDTENLLVIQTANVQATKQMRFSSIEEITEQKEIIKNYIEEAIKIEKSGEKVEFTQNTNLKFPIEFETIMNENNELKKAFESLTPGRQRAYNLFFSAPKQSKTIISRISKCIPQILNGKGLND